MRLKTWLFLVLFTFSSLSQTKAMNPEHEFMDRYNQCVVSTYLLTNFSVNALGGAFINVLLGSIGKNTLNEAQVGINLIQGMQKGFWTYFYLFLPVSVISNYASQILNPYDPWVYNLTTTLAIPSWPGLKMATLVCQTLGVHVDDNPYNNGEEPPFDDGNF